MTMKFPERINIQYDVSNEGDPDPSFADKVRWVPAHIQQITGDETFRGRQLEGRIDYVISIRMQDVDERNRIKIASGDLKDRVCNIEWVKHLFQRNGRPPMLELYCRELSG